MSVIWSGVTEEGAVVPVQVTDEGKVVAVGDGPQGEYLPITGGTLTGDLNVADGINLKTDGSATFQNDVLVGGTLPSAPNISLNANGRAVFQNTDDDKIQLSPDSSAPRIDLQTGAGADTVAMAVGTYEGQGGVFNCDASNSWIAVNGEPYIKTTVRQNLVTAVGKDSVLIGGTLPASPNITLNVDGSAAFAGPLHVGTNAQADGDPDIILGSSSRRGRLVGYAPSASSSSASFLENVVDGVSRVNIKHDGSAVFSGDVVIGSRGEKWLIRESNGVAMLVQQSREAAPMIPEAVRDIPAELDLIEMALNEVMEKLRMTPPAGWPVWDGSDNP